MVFGKINNNAATGKLRPINQNLNDKLVFVGLFAMFAQTQQESFGQAFSKACGFLRQGLKSTSADNEIVSLRSTANFVCRLNNGSLLCKHTKVCSQSFEKGRRGELSKAQSGLLKRRTHTSGGVLLFSCQ